MRWLPAVALAALAAGGCGGGDGRPQLTVSAASSLTDALTAYAADFEGADVRLSFAGSDALAAQIRSGAKPDVFVSADRAIAARLNAEGLTGAPRVVARNRLVVATANPLVQTLADLLLPGVTVALGAATVPVGTYADEVLARLPLGPRIRRRVRTREPDAGGVIGKVIAGAVDAGFVYATDARAPGGDVRAIELPASVQPRIEYAAVVVRPGDAAARFVEGLPAALRRAGFAGP